MGSEGPYIDLHFEDGQKAPGTGAVPVPTIAELVLPWRGQDADFPDFREVVAALFVLLHKYSHQEDLALGLLNVQAKEGLPRSTRTVRVTEVSSCSFEDLKVAAGEAEAKEAAEAAEVTQVLVGDGDAQDFAGVCGTAPAGFELMVCRCSGQDGKVMKWVWRRSCFSETFVRRAQDHLGRLLQLGRGSESRVREWVWTSQGEDRQVLGSFNLTTTTSSCETSVLDLVAQVAADMPAHSAVVQDGDMLSPLSYAQLWSLAGRVAVAARQALPDADVGAVAILLARGVSMVLALLGVWRAGGRCVPLDLRAPRPRLEQMLKDAEVRLAITKRDLQLTWLQSPAILYMEDFQDTASLSEGLEGGRPTYASDDVAYVLFTSGSTGVPKGVLLTHQNILAYTRWHVPYYQLTHEDRVPHAAGLSFDASLAEIWPTLSVGGCVLPVPDDNLRLLPEALCKWYAEAGATVAFLTTQLAEAVLAEPHYPSMRLRTLFTGGDKLHVRPPHHAPFQLVNIYGPTECCVNVTMCQVCPGEGLPSIGEPVPNMQLYVLDPDMRPQPCGLVGELCVGGLQVAAGYLNRLDLTAASFVPNPFEGRADEQGRTRWPHGPAWQGRAGPGPAWEGPSWVARSVESSPLHGPRLYKTGDLVRWADDGSLLYVGRIDFQVKIRGQRIELGEIEAKMLQHQAVRECVVNCHELPDHDKILVGYWTPKAGVSDAPDLEQHLQADLPEYMIPKVFMKMDRLILTANGKVDRKALPPPSLGVREEVPLEDCEPEQLEAELRGAFAAVLSKKVSEVPVSASFFALGGHSISVGQLVNRIRRELQLNAAIADVYSSPSVKQLAARLRRLRPKELEDTGTQAGTQADQSETRSDAYVASFQQLSLQRMASVSAAASAALNLAFCGHVRGSLKVRCLQQAFRALCGRHDALRSVFVEHECKILSVAESALDFRHVEPGVMGFGGFELDWLLDQQYETFDLEAGPLCRVRVFQESEDNWILHWTLHHVSADLWSYTILLKELEAAYEHYIQHDDDGAVHEPPWPSSAPQYRDYALQEKRFLESEEGKRSRSYWQQKLQKTPPVLDLPGATASERKPTFKGSKLDFEVSSELSESLRSLGQRCEASLHATLLTAWMVLLSRYGQEEDICVGTPMACRTTAESEATVGYFANPVCIRAIVSNTYEKLLRDVAMDVTDSLQHQRVPLSHVCDDLGLDLRALLQPLFVFQTCPDELYQSRLPSFFMGHEGSEISLGPLRLESIGFGQKFTQFDLALVVAHGPRGDLIGSFQYSTTSYTRDAVLRLQAQYLTILQSMVKDPSQDVGQVPLFVDEDLAELRRRVTSPWLQDLPNDSLPRLVASRAAENPSAFAVVSPQGTYTFGEVLRRAQLLATALLEEASFHASSGRERQGSWQGRSSGGRELSGGLLSCRVPLVEESEAAQNSLSLSVQGQGDGSFLESFNLLVGLMVSPGPWMVAGPLGCWMAGRGYFALDSEHPTERIQQMAQDAHPQCILCERRAQSVANSLGWPVLVTEELQSRRSSAGTSWPYLEGDGQALLVFTSGSTGRPKGVLLSMRAVLAHVMFSSQHFGFKAGQATLQHTSWTFDAPICEIWPALLSGATVVISKRDGSKDFQYLASLVDEQRVSHALFVPSLLAEILEHQALPRSLRSLVVVGEACSLSLARRILEAPLSLNNFYGPSEAGIGATIYEVDKIGAVPNHVQSLPIGRPVSWHEVILLDPKLRPALGGVGQIGILGEGLASGYLRLPQETKTRFIKTPEAIREVLPHCGPITYLTGDVGRYCQDDILEFVGRLDSQVKLRGQRVELGEIEAALLSAKAVTEAVALVHGDRLIGYFSTLQGVEEGDAVAQCVDKTRQRLPRYMWPELVHVKEWPRGRTGKVDRKALPLPTICVQDAVPPRSSLEKKILGIFCQALRRDPTLTSVHSDFFTLGGTSLKAAALLSALRAQVPEAVALQFDELYAHPDVASLAQVLSGSRQEILLGPAPVEGLLPASLGQEHMLVLQELHEGSSAYNSPLILKLEGALNRSALSAALDRVIARHDVLRSNLLRDTIDGEPAVVQVTTPAAEFQCDMEFWDIPEDTAQQPQRRRLGSRHVGAAGAERASSFQLSSWLGRTASATGLGPGTPERGASWRNLFDRGRARRPSWSPIFYQGYNSPPMRSPEGNRDDRIRLTEMTSTSSLSLGDLGRAQQWSPGCSELVLSWLVEEAQKPFNLRDEPLIRIVLAKVGSEQHFLLVNMHHSVTDGRSLSILRQELTAFYNQIALKLAEAPKLPALSMQYADFAYCQRRWMAQGRLERELAYWRSQLQQLPALQLLTDFSRPPNLALDGGQVTFQLQPALANRLRSLARAKSVTLFALLLGLFALALSRWAGAQDLAIASPVGHRQGNAVEPLIGYFVNTVLFRVNLKTCTFEDLLQRLRDTVVGAFQNSSAPYAKVLEAAELDPAAVPAMFVLQDRDETAWSMEGLRVEQVEIKRHAALFDVTCEMQEMPGSAGGLQGVLVYNKHLWTNSRAVRFAESLQTLALAVAEQPAVDLLQLAVISSNDRAKVLEWGGHNRRVSSPTPLIKALKVQLLQCQHDIAVLSGDRSVTYAELGARVTALALALREELSEAFDSEVLVALLLPRSVDLAVAIWAVLSTGAAYVPIDADYPPQRIAHILLSAGPRLALARKEHAELATDIRVFGTWQWPSPETSARVEELTQAPPQGLAYVIYTSGSTGKPKGVAIEHRSAANMVQEQLSLMRITREDRVLQFFKPAFDGAVQEYLSTFLAGAVLVLWGEDKEESFAEVLSRHRCTACTLTPSALSVLDPKRLPLLTKLAVAAEACPPTLVELWACQRRLLNAYGPSENTVVATSAELGASESSNDFILRSDSFDSLMSAPSRQHVPIGTPLGGVQCYVFEATAVKSLQAIGTPGELCLGGVQLARGYFGDAAKTAEKFVINPLGCQKMQRMYKTGDIVTWLPQGQLLYLGRNDEMVKVRGFRIELSEVEAALAALGAQAVAVAVNPVKDGLWAWVTPETLSPATLRSELLKALPQYMVPTRIAVLEKFPLTPNGKIDKARLLAENCSEAHTEGPIVAPQSPLEHRLCATAATVLGLETLGVTADLRSVGMTSLKAVLLSQKLRDTGLTIPLSKLYELQTVRALAEHLALQEETVLGPVNEADVESGRRFDLCLSASQKGCSGLFRSVAVLCWRLLAWVWISGVVIWPAMLPLKLSSQLARSSGAAWSLCFLVLVGYPLYLLLMILLVICTKWLLIGKYRAGACSVNSWAFLRWWAVDRMLVFVNELCLGAFRGGPVYFAYLRSLGLQATGYCRIDTRHVSEFDLISLGRCCVVAEGAKLRPAAAEAGELQLRPLAFGDYCAVGENAVCTAGCAVGDHVTLQPLSMLCGRTGRTLPDGSVWKGALLVQSRQQPIRVPAGFLCHDLLGDVFALLLTLFLQTGCSLVAYCTFGLLAEAQGFGVGDAWRWQAEPEGYLFAATWLLFGPPVMASADVLLDIDLAGLADQVMASMGLNQWEFGLRLAGMVVVSFAVYGWSLTLSSAFLCRYIRGSRNLNSWFFQVRRVVLRLTFPRYPAQLAGTWAMSLYLRLLGGRVSLHATVAVSEPPLEPRKLHVGEGALLLTHQALGECEVGQGSVVGAGAVLLPHSQVEAGAVVGAMSVAGRPVRSGLQLVGNPGVIMRRATLEQEPMAGWGRHFLRRSVKFLYPLLAPMFLQMLLLTTLLPAMYVLTVLLDMLVRSQHGAGLVLAASLPAAYVALGWCLCLLAVLVHRLLSASVNGSWCAFGSVRHFLATFTEQLNSMSIAIFMGMAFGSPFYNFWLKAMGANVASDALLLTAVAGDYRALNVGRGASVDKEAVLSCRRLLPGPQGAGFYICQSRVVIGPGSSVSHSAAVVAGETGSLSTLAPLSAVAPSTRLPAQTFAVGLPPQAFPWSKASLVKPSARPLPRELRPPILLPLFVSRAIGRMKVLQGQQAVDFTPLVTGSTGFLGRSIVAALLESGACSRVFCLVRAADPAAAQQRVMEAAKKAGATDLHLLEAVPGDLQQRNFGRPLADVQRLAGRVTHVLHCAAKVNLTEPFELMKKDNVDATSHLLEFCCMSRPKPFHHISTMGILTPGMLDRHGSVRENATLGDIRALPLYGTGDQANGYPQSKWLAEVLVLEAARQGLPCYIHRPGLIGGHSVTGAAAEDVFFHFLADVLKLRRLPGMEGRKFNVTPVDWVAKAIARIALPGFLEEGKLPSGSVFHPAAPNNAITTNVLAAVLKRFGYGHLAFMDFVDWRDSIVGSPLDFKSWSFCAALSVEGDGIDSMAETTLGAKAIREAVGEAFDNYDPADCLVRMLRWYTAQGLLPQPESARPDAAG